MYIYYKSELVLFLLEAEKYFFFRQQEAPHSNMISVSQLILSPLWLGQSVPLLGAIQVPSLIFAETGKYKRRCLVVGEEESPSDSVSVLAQEDDVVCNDGGSLTSHLILVHILPIVQFPLN